MHIEELVTKLIDAIDRNTAAQIANIEGREKAIAAATGKAAAEKKDAPASAPASAPEKKETKRGKVGRTSKSKVPTEEQVKAKFADFLDTEDTDERATRVEWLEALLNELGADAVTDKPDKGKKGIAPEDRQRALDLLAKKMAGEDVNFGADAEEEDEDSSLL